MKKSFNTFDYNRRVRKNAARVLISAGKTAREAIGMIRENMEYLFWGKKQCDERDTMNEF